MNDTACGCAEVDRKYRLYLVFLIAALLMMLLMRDVDSLRTAFLSFSGIILEAFPFMLLGSLVGGIIEEYMPKKMVNSLKDGHLKSVLLGGLIGFAIPVCECAVVTVVYRLIRKGVSPGAAIAYMLAGPTINPIVALSTLVAYRFSWKIMALRIMGGYTIAVIVALIVQKCAGDSLIRTDITSQKNCSLTNSGESGSRWNRVMRTAAGDFIMAGKYLVMGAFLAGLLQSIVSRSIIAGVIASPVMSILMMMGLAVCLSICSDGDAFVAASFGKNAFPLSSQMSFMLIGPMLDIKLMLMYRIVFRKRAIPLIAISVITVVLCVSYLLHVLGPVFT